MTNRLRRNLPARITCVRSNARRRRLGTASVEFGLVAPVFLLLVFGLFEFGRLTMIQQAMTDAARSGCREAVLATTRNSDDVEAVIRAHLGVFFSGADDPAICQIQLTPSDLQQIPRGTEITATVEVACGDVSWIMQSVGPDRVIRGEMTMKRE